MKNKKTSKKISVKYIMCYNFKLHDKKNVMYTNSKMKPYKAAYKAIHFSIQYKLEASW